MLKLTKNEYYKIEDLIYSRARDLEIAILQHHMDDEDRVMAAHALTIYQNSDGGFGHGLEADNLNPNSSSIQTQYALSVLKELGYNSSNLDEVAGYIVNKSLNYVFQKVMDEEGYICATVESNNECPCASWWKHSDKAKEQWGYNPTAYLYALGLYFASPASKYYKKIMKFLPTCLDYYLNKDNIDGHELRCFIELYDVMLNKKIMPEILEKLGKKINEDIDKIINSDLEDWGKGYSGCVMPLDLLVYDHLVNTSERKELIEKHLDFIITSRGNALWDISWDWGNDYQEFELQRIKWRGVLTVNNLVLLKKYNRIDD